MTKAVFCLASNDEQSRRIVDRLLSSGFSNEDISFLFQNRNRNEVDVRNYNYPNPRDNKERSDVEFEETSYKKNGNRGCLRTEKHTKAPEGGVTGATAGGILGGSFGLLAGLGALAIPGLGPFIAAGPIMAALSGSAVGGGVGLLIGALIGSGIPEYEATRYEAGLKEGNTLISVHTNNDEEVDRAIEIMKQEGATDISTSREKAASAF